MLILQIVHPAPFAGTTPRPNLGRYCVIKTIGRSVEDDALVMAYIDKGKDESKATYLIFPQGTA